MVAEQPTLRQGALHALTAAALALPGLTLSAPGAAQDNVVVTQFGRYQESSRELYGVSSRFKPMEVDSLQATAWLTLTDRYSLQLDVWQDAWSGATPMATAPREWRGNRPRDPDTTSGATPYLTMSGPLYLDRKSLQPLRTDGFGNLTGGADTQLVHTISGASREVRQQFDFKLRRGASDAAFELTGGVSTEPDYLSRFVGLSGQWDFDQKLTTLNAGLSYTWSATRALLDHDATPYIYNACGTPQCNFVSTTAHIETTTGGGKVLYGDRHDWGANVGVTRILNPQAQVQANLAFVGSRGYLSNPYKVVEVAFIDPDQQFLAPNPDVLVVNVNSILEKRPDQRNQWTGNIRYAQYVNSTEGSLHVGYTYFTDDWGIRAHTLEASYTQPMGTGWTVTPMLRYYTQTAASFYTPYLVTNQGQSTTRVDPNTGNPVTVPFDLGLLPSFYSSDYRLSAFGALTGGLTLVKKFDRGVTAQLGVIYYQHAGSLKWGGGGEGSYSDFDSYLVNASLAFDLNRASSLASLPTRRRHHQKDTAHAHSHSSAPAGVMFDHVLPVAGNLMAGVRYMGTWQSGSMQRGRSRLDDDAEIKARACNGAPCLTVPTSMSMGMSMLELMYAPTNWVTLMVMPTYMTMNMESRGLLDAGDLASLPADLRSMYTHHTMHDHTAGGIGDTGIYASFALHRSATTQVIGTLGVTAPTGDVGVRLRDTHQIDAGYQHYGMQLGSGTWDFNPSVTYLGTWGTWFGGAQLSGVLRMESRNDSGYRLGNVVQATAWAGRQWDNGLATTLRAAYLNQGAIVGEFNGTFHQLSSADQPKNYGGRFWDLGVGATYAFGGSFAGNEIGIEWLQPIADDPNGYQLQRRGTLYAAWKYAF